MHQEHTPLEMDTKAQVVGWIKKQINKIPNISLRCVDGLEMKRALGLNRDYATYFYNLLQQVYNAHEYHPNQI